MRDFKWLFCLFQIHWKIVQIQCIYPEQAECQFAIAVLPPAGSCEGPVIRLNIHFNAWHSFSRLKARGS